MRLRSSRCCLMPGAIPASDTRSLFMQHLFRVFARGRQACHFSLQHSNVLAPVLQRAATKVGWQTPGVLQQYDAIVA